MSSRRLRAACSRLVALYRARPQARAAATASDVWADHERFLRACWRPAACVTSSVNQAAVRRVDSDHRRQPCVMRQPVEELLEGSEPVVRRGAGLTGDKLCDEVLDVLLADRVSGDDALVSDITAKPAGWASPYVSTVLGDLFSAYRRRSNDVASLSSSPTLPVL
jgi:hypothetical protein